MQNPNLPPGVSDEDVEPEEPIDYDRELGEIMDRNRDREKDRRIMKSFKPS